MPKAKEKIEWNKCFNKNIDFAFDDGNPFTAINQGFPYGDKFQTFYGAITKSSQWKNWYKEQMKRFREGQIKKNQFVTKKPVFDIDESIGIGSISDEHLQEFFKFIKEQ
jgi:hypothetical protein